MDSEQEKIIRAEIERLERAYRGAQDRYAYSGSRSTDSTMYKYQTLIDALENCLTGNRDKSRERMIMTQQDQLYRLKEAIGEAYRGHRIDGETYVKLTEIFKG